MTQRTIRGDAPAVNKVIQIPVPQNYVTGAINIHINNKTISYPEWNLSALVDEWNGSVYPETKVATASALNPDDFDGEYGIELESLILTANVAGEDFFVTVTIGDNNETNEIQTLLFEPAPSGGTFTLTFNGQTTAAITYVNGDPASTASNILTALVALSNIAPGDVVVEAINQTEYQVTFEGIYLGTDVPLMTVDYTNLLGGDASLTVTTVQNGTTPIDEVQTLSLPSGPTGGTFTLTYEGQTTAPIAYNANSATVQAALVALSNLAPGDVVCSGGALPGTSVVITFGGTLAGTNVSLITGNGASLTGGSGNISGITTTTGGSAGVNNIYQFWRNSSTGANVAVDATARWFCVQADGSVEYSTAFAPATDTLATIKALLVGMTVGYFEGPEYVDYPILTTDIDLTAGTGSGRFTMELEGNLAGRASGLTQSIISSIGLVVGATTTPVQAYRTQSETLQEERQDFTIDDDTVVGTFTLTVYDTAGNPHTTGSINYGGSDDTAAEIQLAINNALGGNYVHVVYIAPGSPAAQYAVTYRNYGYQGVNITILSANETSVSVSETTPGDPGLSEIHRIDADGSVVIRGGTFTITYLTQTTGAIAYNATADTIRLALEALSNIDPGDVAVSGSISPDGSILLTWSGVGNIQQPSVTSSLINSAAAVTEYVTGGVEIFCVEIVRNAGPECFDDPLNYDPQGLPSDGDAIVFEFGQTAVRWGTKQRDTFTVSSVTNNTLQLGTGRWLFQNGQCLRVKSSGTPPGGLTAGNAYYVVNSDGMGLFQLSTTLGGSPVNITDAGTGTHTIGLQLLSLTKPARFTDHIGLPRMSSAGFEEYRPRFLEVWVTTNFVLGERQGTDSGLQRYDLGDTAITNGILIYSSGSSDEEDAPAIGILINQAATNLKSYGGEVGFAPFLDDESTLQDIEVYDTQLSSIGLTTCRNIKLDKDSSIRGNFDPSGNLTFGV